MSKRVALVTGASKGIGFAISRDLARAGYHVFLVARTAGPLAEAASLVKSEGGSCETVAVDVTDPVALALLPSKLPSLDVLVNNAGGAPRFGTFAELTDEDWQHAFNLNVLAAVRLVRVLRPLLERAAHPRIVNIGSSSAVEPGRSNPHYCATKAALWNLTRFLATELSASGVTVNLVQAGPTESAAWNRLFEQRAGQLNLSADQLRHEILQGEVAKIPLGRLGRPEDIARVVTFLASPDSSWITGAAIDVDGGKRRSI